VKIEGLQGVPRKPAEATMKGFHFGHGFKLVN